MISIMTLRQSTFLIAILIYSLTKKNTMFLYSSQGSLTVSMPKKFRIFLPEFILYLLKHLKLIPANNAYL
ncbi:MAG: hypothetical protein D4R81_05220 [Nitrospiraceae bacterium]|nr:MAG: hypothetical protein D4R81_05220 [Nitrospiraceae bacterium]